MPAGAASSGPAAWTVTGQQETMDLDPGGQLVSGYRVSFTTPSGAVGSIFVAKKNYTAQAVKALLAAHVAELEAVARSTGA